MISRATAPTGAGPSKEPPSAPANMAAPKNRIQRVRNVFLLRGQDSTGIQNSRVSRGLQIYDALRTADSKQSAPKWSPHFPLAGCKYSPHPSPAGSKRSPRPSHSLHYKMPSAILRVAVFGRGGAERFFFAVADCLYPIGRYAQRNHELLGCRGTPIPQS